jgi:hypothetical protein
MSAITSYFQAERAESVVFVVAGLMALGMALWAWRVNRQPFWRGAAWPLALIAAIQITVGGTIWQRSPQDAARVQQIVTQDKARIAGEEIPRMQTVMRSFALYRWIEIGLLALGLALVAWSARASWRQGLGAGLAVQSGVMLVLDFFAEQRGEVYLAWLRGV